MALGKGLNSLIPQKSPKIQIKEETLATTAMGSSLGQEVLQIPLKNIVPNREQPRTHFDQDALRDLVASIQKHGIMQPLVVSKIPDGGYELIAGERRFRAARQAGLATVPAIVREAGDQERLELALIENIQRQDLNPIEEALSFQRLIKEFGLTQQQVADQVGKSRPAVANTIRLLDLPEEIIAALKLGEITAGKARPLLSLKNSAEQLVLFREMMNPTVSARDVERVVSEKKSQTGKAPTRKRDPNILALEKLLEETLGTKVRIQSGTDKGTIIVEYYGAEELKRLVEDITA